MKSYKKKYTNYTESRKIVKVQMSYHIEYCCFILDSQQFLRLIFFPFFNSDLGEDLMKVSAIAEVNGEPWDMHRPIESDCELKLLHFHSLDPTVANKAFWRSGSFLLGAVIELAFREEIPVVLHSFPAPNGI